MDEKTRAALDVLERAEDDVDEAQRAFVAARSKDSAKYKRRYLECQGARDRAKEELARLAPEFVAEWEAANAWHGVR